MSLSQWICIALISQIPEACFLGKVGGIYHQQLLALKLDSTSQAHLDIYHQCFLPSIFILFEILVTCRANWLHVFLVHYFSPLHYMSFSVLNISSSCCCPPLSAFVRWRTLYPSPSQESSHMTCGCYTGLCSTPTVYSKTA